MCNCIMMGNVKIIDGIIFIDNEEITDLPDKLRRALNSNNFDCSISKKGTTIINEYEYKNGKFKKTLRAWIKYKF